MFDIVMNSGARFLVSRLMGYLDLGPRLSVPLLFAVGLHLGFLGGWATLPLAAVWLTWFIAIVWCAALSAAKSINGQRW